MKNFSTMTETLSRTIERWKIWWWLMRGHDVVLLFEEEINCSRYSKAKREEGYLSLVGFAHWRRKERAVLRKDGRWSDGQYFGTYIWIKAMTPWKGPLEINVRARYGNLRPA